MGKRGKLSIIEKAAIKGALSEGKSNKEIATMLDRTERVVSNYIDGELDSVAATIAKVQLEKSQVAEEQSSKEYRRYCKPDTRDVAESQPDNKEAAPRQVASAKVIEDTRKELSKAGLIPTDVTKLLNKALTKGREKGMKFKEVKDLYKQCIAMMNAGEFFVKQTDGGSDGVAIMTPAVSQRMDNFRKSAAKNKTSRSTRGNVYQPSTGKII